MLDRFVFWVIGLCVRAGKTKQYLNTLTFSAFLFVMYRGLNAHSNILSEGMDK